MSGRHHVGPQTSTLCTQRERVTGLEDGDCERQGAGLSIAQSWLLPGALSRPDGESTLTQGVATAWSPPRPACQASHDQEPVVYRRGILQLGGKECRPC
jgi:hypothetical protein